MKERYEMGVKRLLLSRYVSREQDNQQFANVYYYQRDDNAWVTFATDQRAMLIVDGRIELPYISESETPEDRWQAAVRLAQSWVGDPKEAAWVSLVTHLSTTQQIVGRVWDGECGIEGEFVYSVVDIYGVRISSRYLMPLLDFCKENLAILIAPCELQYGPAIRFMIENGLSWGFIMGMRSGDRG